MATLQLKRGAAARWRELNIVLAAGEPGFVTDENRLKIGDGVTPWNDLPYICESGVINASTHNDFPATGREDVIYKAESEKLLYQWNATNLKYEVLGKTEGSGDLAEIEGLKTRMSILETIVGRPAVGDNAAAGIVKLVADNAAAIAVEATAREEADKVNADAINTIESLIGAVAEGKTVVEMIADAAYDDTTLVGRVQAIEDDHLNAADKTELQDQITANANAIKLLMNGTSADDVDSINDLIQYVKDHGAEVIGMKDDIAANTVAIGTIEGQFAVLEGKVHEHENKALLDTYTQTNEDLADAVLKKHEHVNATILDGITTEKVAVWDEAEKNVIASVDETQFAIDDARHLTLLDVAIGKVAGLQGALDDKANKGTTLVGYGITDAYTKTETERRIQEVLSGLSDTSESAASVAQALETYKTSNDARVDTIEGKLARIADGAQANVIEAIKINGVAQEIADKTVNIPMATNTLLGVVVGSTAENKVSIAVDGTMNVNSLNVNKLVQTDGEYLVLNGGSSVF